MTEAETLFAEISKTTTDSVAGKMFGCPCLKAPNGKAGVFYKNQKMCFKLPEPELSETLSLDGAKIFEPVEGRKMGGWVELPFAYSEKWPELAEKAMVFVKKLPK